MSRSAADVERLATQIAVGTPAQSVREVLGDPLVKSELADGGETWLYVPVDTEQGQYESLSVAFDAGGGFVGLQRKPID
jgi:hypothetical protein